MNTTKKSSVKKLLIALFAIMLIAALAVFASASNAYVLLEDTPLTVSYSSEAAQTITISFTPSQTGFYGMTSNRELGHNTYLRIYNSKNQLVFITVFDDMSMQEAFNHPYLLAGETYRLQFQKGSFDSGDSIVLLMFKESNLGGKCGPSVYWTINDDAVLTISGIGRMFNYNGKDQSMEAIPWRVYFSQIKKIVIKDGVTSVGDFAFFFDKIYIKDGDQPIKTTLEVSLPHSLESIGSVAFAYCEGLSAISIPKSVYSIGAGAFEYTALQSIRIDNPKCVFHKTVVMYDDGGIDTFEAGAITLGNNIPIYGYAGSTSEAYAAEYGRQFIPLGNNPWSSITDQIFGISVDYINSDLPAGTTLSVEEIDIPESTVPVSCNKIFGWNIKPLSNGTAVQPLGSVILSLPLTGEFDTDRLLAYHITDQGNLEFLNNTVIGNGTCLFGIDSFSSFFLVETSELHEHEYQSITTINPTCKNPGEETYSCICGDIYTEDLPIDPGAHVFKTTVVAPSCLDDGYTSHTCTLCRYGYADNEVPALGHAALDENGDCPRCHRHIQDMPQPEPSEEEQPSPKLNFFQRIIQWFKDLFAKLFKKK